MKGRVLHYIWSLMLFTLMLPGIIRTDQEGAANPLQEKLSEQTDLPTLIQLAYERNPGLNLHGLSGRQRLKSFHRLHRYLIPC